MRLLVLAVFALAVLFSLSPARVAPPSPPAAIDFVRDIRPLLESRCLRCHGPERQKGDLRLDSRESLLRSGSVVPGKSAASPLLQRVAPHADEGRMPPAGPRLTQQQITLLRAWIDQGARMPQQDATLPQSIHWAYRRLERPAVPRARDRSRVINPIDDFIQARLEQANLLPAPPAASRVLLRRLYLDLLGLPPTPEELEAFVHDPRPDAYERRVDDLLASPAYGERYARHWLDVVHFAETHGHDQDVPRENAWPYRDYLIQAFNDDRPWARMIEEQVAGDILFPDSPDGIVATGLLAAGPWDESSQQSIRDDTLDKQQAQNLDRDDIVTTVLSAFSSTTVHCARCHDHKFDPISQVEYYGLQAVFAGIDRAERAYDPDPSVHRRRQALLSRQKELQAASPDSLLSPDNEARVLAWATERRRDVWKVLSPLQVTTTQGSIPTALPDGSVRFGGPRPERDAYTLIATTSLLRITAVRLEVLPDDTLPRKGPGRQDNGNLHLNEFRLEEGPPNDPDASTPVKIRSASADFNQSGWDVSRAIDGQPATAWGIYPEVGKPHQAVFLLARPIARAGGSRLVFTLEQTHGQGHLIGRLRLAITESAHPTAIQPLPPEVSTALAVPPTHRTPAQRALLVRHVLLEEVRADLAALPAPRRVFAAASDFFPVNSFRPAKGCRPVHVLRRGEISKPIRLAEPAALSCLPDLPGRLDLSRPEIEGARRAALARWLSDRRNALTWRSMANRLWHLHFGRGIVPSVGDLGRMGASPSHPQLLDWLAVELRDSGSLKHLHRLILTSAAYRRAVRHDPIAARVDADNLLLWRMNRTRLDAESLRDSLLAVSGRLDRRMGGPSVKQFVLSPGIHVTPNVDYSTFDLDAPGANRRSIYRFIFRTLPDPFFETFDCPDASQFTPVRSSSITALQALALLNDRFLVRQAELFAARLQRESGTALEPAIRRAYLLALARPADPDEVEALASYARRHSLAAACRLLLNCNEFLFVD